MTIGALPDDLKRKMDMWNHIVINELRNVNWAGWSWYLTYLLRLESLARQIPDENNLDTAKGF